MPNDTTILEEKERTLAQYLESITTDELLKEVQAHTPSIRPHSNIHGKLTEMKLPQPVKNTLIYYVLATTKHKFVTYKLLVLSDLCRKFNIKNSQEAITFFKQYYSFHTYNENYNN